MQDNLLSQLKKITTFIFDIDGVLTSGNLLVTENGNLLRSVNIKDGFAIQHAIKKGVNIAILSGAKEEGLRIRFGNLGISQIHLGQENKIDAFEKIKSNFNCTNEQICYMGDDIPDLVLMQQVGLSACPNDACDDIKKISSYISPKNGGDGCVRLILEQYLKLHHNW